MITFKIENTPDTGQYWQVSSNGVLPTDSHGKAAEFIDVSVRQFTGNLQAKNIISFVLYNRFFDAIKQVDFRFADAPETWEGFTFTADWIANTISVDAPGKSVSKSDDKWIWYAAIGVILVFLMFRKKPEYGYRY